MGLFFDDEPKQENEEQITTKNHSHGTFGVAMLMLLAFFFTVLGWILKPLLTWAFTFEGRTRPQVTAQLCVILLLFGGGGLLLYKIPFIRDAVSLSKTHTVNISNEQGRILFPDRSYFIPEGNPRALNFNEAGNSIYTTYSGYRDKVAEHMSSPMCQLVPRTEKIILSSDYPPVRAEGFEDSVKYIAILYGKDLPVYHRMLLTIAHPSTLFDDEELNKYGLHLELETSWREFLDNWNRLEILEGSESRWFEIQALSGEHAIICF